MQKSNFSGDGLRRWLEGKGWKDSFFCRMLGISHVTLWKRKKADKLSLETALACRALDEGLEPMGDLEPKVGKEK